MVAERRDRAAGGDPEAGLDHAAEHHAEPERARRVRHPHGLADPARLRELDVDPVRDLARRRRRRRACGSPRRRRSGCGERALQLGPARVAGRKRLLAVLDAERLRAAGSASSASSSDQYSLTSTWSGSVGHARAPRGRARRRARRAPPSFSFSRRNRAGDALGAARHVVGIAEPDRPRGRRAGARQPEQAPDRLAERASRRGRAARRRAPPSPPARPGRSASGRRSPRARTGRRRAAARPPRGTPSADAARLVVALDRRRLAEPGRRRRADLDLDDVGDVLRLARDHERSRRAPGSRSGRSAPRG